MKLFTKNKEAAPVIVVIVGCNKAGIALSEVLSAKGFKVTVVDKSPHALENFSSVYGENILLGDATDSSIMDQADFQAAKAIFVVTSSDNTNIFITQIIRQKLKSGPKVMSRLNDLARKAAYAAFDIETISVEDMFANEIGHNMTAWIAGEQP